MNGKNFWRTAQYKTNPTPHSSSQNYESLKDIEDEVLMFIVTSFLVARDAETTKRQI